MNQPVILVIEDQKSMADLLQEKLQQQSGLETLVAYNFQEAKQIIESQIEIVVCITDLNLPDAEEGATVELLHKHHITTVVLTANYTEDTRKKMFMQRVADYVIKDGMAAINYAVKTVVNLVENANHTIWVLTTQTKNSKRLIGLLNIHRYKVGVFDDPKALYETLKTKTPDLLIMNESKLIKGFSRKNFIQEIRGLFSQNQLPVLISEESVEICEIIRLMKYGVNDFYNHSFTVEELYVRLQMNLSLTLSYKKIEKISRTDPLTGLYNRRYFFEHAKVIRQQNAKVSAVMMDIDFFKKVNDTYGHDKGDEAIIFAANIICDVFKNYLVARFGGEEFCVLAGYDKINEILDLCEVVRSRIVSESKNEIGVPITISIGVGHDELEVDKLITDADKALYQSKENGRNQVTLNV